MMEWPESRVVSRQMNETIRGKRIEKVSQGNSPHKFFFTNKEAPYLPELLEGRALGQAKAYGIYIEVEAEENALLLGEGINLRFIRQGQAPPPKYQILLELEGGDALSGSIQMYGGAWAYPKGTFENPYYTVAKEKPSPYTDDFDESWFEGLHRELKPNLSAKAFLATEQRIPGLGNGVLQDILLLAGIHPKRKIGTFSDGDWENLYEKVKTLLKKMEDEGGRDTEKDLFGTQGQYRVLLSAKTWKEPCPLCGGKVEKQNYLGGSIYFCPTCQPLQG
ncbi:endonuclease VIII [Ruminococcaceae bacterium OttesenSCG-928-I18]|nr:endonuclease VIII [Ruminococcaceae bacterium OttesenSCG-928-I18]